jgi:hypothetical protein
VLSPAEITEGVALKKSVGGTTVVVVPQSLGQLALVSPLLQMASPQKPVVVVVPQSLGQLALVSPLLQMASPQKPPVVPLKIVKVARATGEGSAKESLSKYRTSYVPGTSGVPAVSLVMSVTEPLDPAGMKFQLLYEVFGAPTAKVLTQSPAEWVEGAVQLMVMLFPEATEAGAETVSASTKETPTTEKRRGREKIKKMRGVILIKNSFVKTLKTYLMPCGVTMCAPVVSVWSISPSSTKVIRYPSAFPFAGIPHFPDPGTPSLQY